MAKYNLNYALNAQRNFEELLKATPDASQITTPENVSLGNPIDISSEGLEGINTQVAGTWVDGQGNTRSYLFKYNRVTPASGLAERSFQPSYKDASTTTTVNHVENLANYLKGLNINLDEVTLTFVTKEGTNVDGVTFNLVSGSPAELKKSNNATFVKDGAGSAFFLKYGFNPFKSIVVKGKEHSLIYKGQNSFVVNFTEATKDTAGFTALSIDVNKSVIEALKQEEALKDVVSDLEAEFNKKVGNPNYVVPGIQAITGPSENNGKNTKLTVTTNVEYGDVTVPVTREISYNRVDISTLGIPTTLVLPDEEVNNGYANLLTFLKQHYGQYVSENIMPFLNAEGSEASYYADGSLNLVELQFTGVSNTTELVNEIKNNRTLTLSAKPDSLLYFGNVSITVTTQPKVIVLNGFANE